MILVSTRAFAEPPPPAWILPEKRMRDADTKPEGSFFSGLPLIGYDPTVGVGLGAGGYYTINGRRDEPLFAYEPYRHRVFLQAFVTTGGYQQHVLSYDGVYLNGTPLRVRASLAFERNVNANYFGVGEASLDALSFQGRTHDTYGEQLDDAAALRPGGIASPDYNRYEFNVPQGSFGLERLFWGGRLRVYYGAIVQYVAVARSDGKPTTGIDAAGNSVDAIHGPTKLGEDCARGAVVGCGGGWNDMLKGSVALDTRDFEPDPRSGVYAYAVGEWAAKGFGSSFDYLRLTLGARFYWSPFPKLADVRLALRFVYSMQSADVPFYAMNTLATPDDDQNGLGGARTMRGYRQDRFIGPVSALANAEVRWTFVHFHVGSQLFALQVAPFFDVGRVFDRVDFAFTRWKPSGGGGLRVAWNHSSIIAFDVGASAEDIGFFVNFGMPY